LGTSTWQALVLVLALAPHVLVLALALDRH